MSKTPETIIVPFEQYSQYDFLDPAYYFFKTAMGDRVYIKTSDRRLAQEVADEWSGIKGKYTVIAAKTSKTKSRRESGELSCRGIATRKK